MRLRLQESGLVINGSKGDGVPSWVLIRYCLAWWIIFSVIVGLAEQIAGTLPNRYPDEPEKRVSHETIYNALYVMPKGELRTELLGCLRQAQRIRPPRARGEDRRGQIQDMVSLHVRPPEVENRLIPGHWEGNLIKGVFNRSAVGALVERSSRLVMLVWMENASAAASLEGFSRILNDVPQPIRKSLTYDQGKEMSKHNQLSERTGVAVIFADPHSPWQRGSKRTPTGFYDSILRRELTFRSSPKTT